MKNLKKEITEILEKNFQDYLKVSKFIFENPELAFKEYKARDILCDLLEKNGFCVKKGIANIETSFEATYSFGSGKTISFLAEYDALKGMGHACGHNIIGTSSVCAGIVLKKIMEKHNIQGTLRIIGTPAEEDGGGKVLMIKEGVFEGIDAAFLLHPSDASMPDDISFATINLQFDFRGKSSHAAAFPWEGKSALNGVISMFNNVNSMRLHIKDNARVHGIITDGGNVHNVIPEKATAVFNIRALNIDYLYELCDMVKNCANGAAISTGTSVEVSQIGFVYKEIKNDPNLVKVIRNNFDEIGENYVERDLSQGIGSTDIANVTHEIPAIQAYIKLDKNIATHTNEFKKAAGGVEGEIALNKAIQVLAMSGLDVLKSK